MAAQVTIGQLARTIGVNVQTIRYYERLKLLGPSARKPSGYRLYSQEEARRLRFIKNAQALGFTLREIKELLALWVTSTARCDDVQKRARAKLVQVESKVADLQALTHALKTLIRACRVGQPTGRCPILMSLRTKRWNEEGSGRRMTTEHESLFEELRHLSPQVTGGLLRMRQATYQDAAVAAKYKLLTAMTISIALRCEPCIRAYVKMAYERGISQQELIEFLEVAMTMQGCPGEEWALKAYAAYKDCAGGNQSTTETACCAH
jgi:Hg(II)-responsive transcriptional regulator